MLDAVAHALTSDEERRKASRPAADLRRCYDSLTPREREVTAFVVSGLMNKQIASGLNLSEITVKIHRGQEIKKWARARLPISCARQKRSESSCRKAQQHRRARSALEFTARE
jgi:FixJ family two-component response regulator